MKPKLRDILQHLITHCNVDVFYAGNQGQFDALVRHTLQDLAIEYPTIRYAVVLAYIPVRNQGYDNYADTMLPEGIERVHPRYAISWRNDWMLNHADYVVTYLTHPWGDAAKYREKAKRKGKTVINIPEG